MGTDTKLMSLTEGEFRASLRGLDGAAVEESGGWWRVSAGGIRARVLFEALPKRRLGGLISMPQARVTLDLASLTDGEAAKFRRAFDIAFQRGGG